MSITLYIGSTKEKTLKAARYACERYLENGLPVLLLGASKFHSSICSPAENSVILSSKISRGYSFSLIKESEVQKISKNFADFSSLGLGILLNLNQTELYQLELIYSIAKFQQRELSKIEQLQSCLAWVITNFFEIPSWYGQLNYIALKKIQQGVLELAKNKRLFKDSDFSLSNLKEKDYLGYGVCNLIDTENLDSYKTRFLLSCLLDSEDNNLKPALVIENISALNCENILELLPKQKAFSRISLTANEKINSKQKIEIINTDFKDLACRSEINSKISTQQIEKENFGSLEMAWQKTKSYARKSLVI